MNGRRNFWTTVGSLIFATILVCRADTIQLGSGQEVKATVTKYRNHAFEVRTDDGKNASYPANSVKRIQFDTRESPSKLVTRTNGAQEGKVGIRKRRVRAGTAEWHAHLFSNLCRAG